MNVAVVDLGVGNMRSLSSALGFLGVPHRITQAASDLESATHVVLPGVGAFDAAMRAMNEHGLAEPIRAAALERKVPTLGVCLGMQLLFEGSAEGRERGLGLLSGRAEKLSPDVANQHKVPHVGFAAVGGYEETGFFAGLGRQAHFYFTHSYAVPALSDANIAHCEHVTPFVAAFQRGKVCGAQFHPEKSQSTGLHLLGNFFELR
jgi:glutamine amidotransferase